MPEGKPLPMPKLTAPGPTPQTPRYPVFTITCKVIGCHYTQSSGTLAGAFVWKGAHQAIRNGVLHSCKITNGNGETII